MTSTSSLAGKRVLITRVGFNSKATSIGEAADANGAAVPVAAG